VPVHPQCFRGWFQQQRQHAHKQAPAAGYICILEQDRPDACCFLRQVRSSKWLQRCYIYTCRCKFWLPLAGAYSFL
jgi:hypothetical protein